MISAAQLEPNRGILVLISAFKRALDRSAINPDDNFFELGGTPWSAMALFSDLSETLGRELSPLLIFHAPTVASLNRLLQEDSTFSPPPLTLMKAGSSEGRPLFLFHGSGSTIMEFFELTKFVHSAGTIYGMQTRGTDGLRPPFRTIEEIAEYHYEAMKDLGNNEPYLLIGYSAGGLVALEVARRVQQRGAKVGLLVMIDTFLPLNTLPQGQLLRLKIRRKSHRIVASMKRKISAFLHPERAIPQGIPIPQTPSMRRFQELDRAVLDRYEAKNYRGQVKFIRARNRWTFPLNPLKMWSPFVEEITVDNSPGDHTRLLSTYYRPLGSLLSQYILEAAREH